MSTVIGTNIRKRDEVKLTKLLIKNVWIIKDNPIVSCILTSKKKRIFSTTNQGLKNHYFYQFLQICLWSLIVLKFGI